MQAQCGGLAGRVSVPENRNRSWRTVKCGESIAGLWKITCQIEFQVVGYFESSPLPDFTGSLASTFVDLPITFPVESHLQQPVLRIVPFAALGTRHIAVPRGSSPIEIRSHGKGHAAAARDEKHAQPRFGFLVRRKARSRVFWRGSFRSASGLHYSSTAVS